ncbi:MULTISPECIES: NACHT domain-containing protein [unclassified Nostoc]|uniref:NACHT domain-containing protein n=1 Tax=unclassified Nostoc TaxID=2593658 RepID=UPI002AD4536C|nr:NACHT domain-containing protein [Nostoc sp. DedQUE03]MDZ7975924.1 NACHT domain-containing protein [Nostoc sp. DedQUE03]MDZ8044759.1 NACHT domain-containing protein [Nostoc sp. DedQUE02]
MSQQPPDNSEPQQPDASSRQQADSSIPQNVVQGNQNRTVQGNDNQAVLGDNNTVVQDNRKSLAWNISIGQSDTTKLSESRNRVRQLLLKQVSTEVESRINSSLHNRVYILLDTEQNPSNIDSPWEMEVKVGSKPKIKLNNTEIIQIFDQSDVAGRLLILGQPGAGKTTIVLKLAEELVKRAYSDPLCAVPVLFSLPTWKSDNQSIKDWLIEQLKNKYGVRKDIAKQWINNQEILPILDGLDELAAERQELCVQKINDFLRPGNWINPLVICSRTEEYQRYQTLLQLNNSLELYPFTSQQVRQYLQNTDNVYLWDSISQDEDLTQLARTPLLLNIIVLSAQEISVPTWLSIKSSKERLTYLFDAYIRLMLKRPYKDKQPQDTNTKFWLSWLAQVLIEQESTEFLIERMQPNLIKNKFDEIIYNLIVWGVIQELMGGLIGVLFCDLILGLFPRQFQFNDLNSWLNIGLFGLIFGLIWGLIWGLISGLSVLINGLIGKQLEDKCQRNSVMNSNIPVGIKISMVISGLISVLISVLISGLIGVLILRLSGLIFRLSVLSVREIGLSFGALGLINWLISILISRLISRLIGDKIEAVETLRFSFKKAFIAENYNQNFRRNFRLICNRITGLSVGLSVGLIWLSGEWNYRFAYDLIGSLSILLIWWLIERLYGGLYGLEIENKTIPNEGIWQSAKNLVFLSALNFLPITISIFLIEKIILNNRSGNQVLNNSSWNQVLIYSLLSGLSFGLLVGISKSGIPVIKHFILRIILWSSGYIPWNYARFLDYCTERLFLQRVGGGYRFIHKLLQEHFAEMEFRRNSENTTKLSR